MVDRCTANLSMMIYFPPGKTITISCPIHGTHVIGGGAKISW